METQLCWGVQIGGIQAASTATEVTNAVDDSPEQYSPDHRYRIEDFMKRHGGPSAAVTQQGRMEAGYRGWPEIYAADGYMLRPEWSRDELRGTIQVAEYPPSA